MDSHHFLQGKEIEILDMNLASHGGSLSMIWKIKFEESVLTVVFQNVSKLKIGEVSAPFMIYGFEIIEHSSSGWQHDNAYEIRDFEEGIVNFFCEKIVI